MTRYTRALALEFRHEYLHGGILDVAVAPLMATSAVLSGEDLLLRPRSGGFELYAEEDADDQLAELRQNPQHLEFVVRPSVTNFLKFTHPGWCQTPTGDVPGDGEIARYSLSSTSPADAEKPAVAVVTTPGELPPSKLSFLLRFPVDFLPATPSDMSTVPVVIRFAARATRWRYLFPELTVEDDIEVVDHGAKVTFAADEDTYRGVPSFTSIESLPLRNRQIQRFELKVNEITTIPRLPCADADWLQPGTTGSDDISEIVVN